MIDVSALVRWLMFAVMVAALTFAGWMALENHRLIVTNAELAGWVTQKVETLEAEISALRKSESEIMDALRTSGSRAADRVIRTVDR